MQVTGCHRDKDDAIFLGRYDMCAGSRFGWMGRKPMERRVSVV
jgi:hypothetical protein